MNPPKGPEKDDTRPEAPVAASPVERLVRAPLYPGALPNLGNVRLLGILRNDTRTVERCLLRFTGH